MQLTLLLGFGSLLGGPLPLITPLLCMSISSERLLAAVSWDRRLVRSQASGAVDVSYAMTMARLLSACLPCLLHVRGSSLNCSTLLILSIASAWLLAENAVLIDILILSHWGAPNT